MLRTIIEFSKTRRNELTLMLETLPYRDAPIRIETVRRALGVLKRVGRNIDMVDDEAIKELLE